MTKTEFLTACGEVLIDPAIALENEAIRAALADKDDSKVRQLLAEEF